MRKEAEMKHNWEYKPLGDCFCYIKNGANIRQSKDAGGYPITRIETLSNGIFNRDKVGYADITDISKYKSYVLADGDLLMSHINSKSYVGRTVKYSAQPNEIFIHGMNLLRLIPHEWINPQYFHYLTKDYYFISKIANIRKDAVNQSSFSISDLRKIPIPVPPMDMQERIVAELDDINAMIEAKREQIKQLDLLAQSIFYTMFGDPVTNPKGFPIVGLTDICEAISTGITYKPESVSGEGTIVLRSSNIQNSKFTLDDIVRIQMPLKESQYVKVDDILMCSRNGSARLVGKVCKIPALSEKMSWGAFMTIIRSKHHNFLFQYFKLPAFRSQLKKTKTSTVNQITIGMLKGIKVPFPPLLLQNQFATQVEAIEAQKQQVEATIAELQTLLDSRMDYWFN